LEFFAAKFHGKPAFEELPGAHGTFRIFNAFQIFSMEVGWFQHVPTATPQVRWANNTCPVFHHLGVLREKTLP